MNLATRPMDYQDAKEIASWEYDPPYSIYNLSKTDIPLLLDPNSRYCSIHDESH